VNGGEKSFSDTKRCVREQGRGITTLNDVTLIKKKINAGSFFVLLAWGNPELRRKGGKGGGGKFNLSCLPSESRRR